MGGNGEQKSEKRVFPVRLICLLVARSIVDQTTAMPKVNAPRVTLGLESRALIT